MQAKTAQKAHSQGPVGLQDKPVSGHRSSISDKMVVKDILTKRRVSIHMQTQHFRQSGWGWGEGGWVQGQPGWNLGSYTYMVSTLQATPSLQPLEDLLKM